MIGTKDFDVGEQILFSLSAQSTRIPILKALLERAKCNQDRPLVYDELIDDFHKLNKKRNYYVHGYWCTHRDTSETYLFDGRGRSYFRSFPEGEKITVTELDEFYKQCVSLDAEVRAVTESYKVMRIVVE